MLMQLVCLDVCDLLESYGKLDSDIERENDLCKTITRSLDNSQGYFSNPKNIDYVLKRMVSLLNNNNLPERKKQFLADVYKMISHK